MLSLLADWQRKRRVYRFTCVENYILRLSVLIEIPRNEGDKRVGKCKLESFNYNKVFIIKYL
jgi:hypothetical protein